MLRADGALLSLCLLAACESPPGAPDAVVGEDAGTSDAGPDAGPPIARRCPGWTAPIAAGVSEVTPDDVSSIAAIMSVEIEQTLSSCEALAAGPAPACGEPLAIEYLRALHYQGEFERCVAFAEACTPRAQRGLFALYGGACAVAGNDVAKAHELFDIAASPEFAAEPDYPGRVFAFVQFAYESHYESEAAAILARVDDWGVDDEVVLRLLDFQLTSMPGASLRDEVFVLARAGVRGDDPILREQLLGLFTLLIEQWAEIALDAERAGNAGAPVSVNTPSMAWIYALYLTLYFEDPLAADSVFDAYARHTNPVSRLPAGFSVWTYTELYEGECRETLSQGARFDAYSVLAERLSDGSADATSTLAEAQKLNADGPTADVLTLIGDMHLELGDDSAAQGAYWEAYELCPEYGRAQSGLQTIRNGRYESAMDDNNAIFAAADAAAAAIDVGDSFERYVPGFGSLDPLAQRRLVHALRTFLPYLGALADSGRQLIVLRNFQLLSDVPTYAAYRDQWAPGDNGLWDDLQRVFGTPAVVGREWLVASPIRPILGPAPLAAFHLYEISPSPLQSCIQELRRRATAEGRYLGAIPPADPGFYFAQGYAAYELPPGAPRRFGVNRAGLAELDPNLHTVIDTIARAELPLEEIECPVPIP